MSYLDPAAPWAGQVGAVPAASTGPRLQAAAIARVALRYELAKAGLMHDEEYEAVLFPAPEQTMTLTPLAVDYDDRDLLSTAPAAARYVIPAAKIATKTYWTTLTKDLTDHLAHNESLDVLQNPDLKLYARVGETPEEFAARCHQAAMAEADKKAAPLRSKYEAKLRTLQTRLTTASSKAQQAQSSGMLDSATSVLGGFLSGRGSMSSITAAARKAQTAKNRADAATAKVDEVQRQIQDAEAELTGELQAIQAEWQAKAGTIAPVAIALKRTQIRVTDLRLVWIPVG